jgi:hypothetical protein
MHKKNYVAQLRNGTVPTERPLLVCEVSANFILVKNLSTFLHFAMALEG